MTLNLELSRMIRDKAVTLIEQAKPHMKEASMAKYFCCESEVKEAHYAVQIQEPWVIWMNVRYQGTTVI